MTMKRAAFIVAEGIIAGLLIALLFLSLLFQPSWIWIAAPLVMLLAFVGIIYFAKRNTRWAWGLVFFSPLVYIAFFLNLFVSIQSPPPEAWSAYVVVATYCAGGVILLAAHLFLNKRVR